jgi:hypothetical protein
MDIVLVVNKKNGMEEMDRLKEFDQEDPISSKY